MISIQYVVVTILCLLYQVKSDYLIFTSGSQKALLYGKLAYQNKNLTLSNITTVDNTLNFPRNVVAYPKTRKIYVCDTIYGDATKGFIYEYSYAIDPVTGALLINDTKEIVHQGYEPLDIEMDNYGNLFFLDRGSGLIAQNLLNHVRSFDILYTKKKTASLSNLHSMAFDKQKQFLYWTRNTTDADGYIYKAFSEPFVIERPFEKLQYKEEAAYSVYAIKDHIYFATNGGKIYLVRYKLSNAAQKITEGMEIVSAMYGYGTFLLIADNEKSEIYYTKLYESKEQVAKKVIDLDERISSPLGIFVIPTRNDNKADL